MTTTPNAPLRTTVMEAAFSGWATADKSTFWLLQAYKHGNLDDLMRARSALTDAAAAIDAALAECDRSAQAREVA
jgi:hypothetical protein